MHRGTTGSVYITSLYLATVKGLWFPSRGDANLLMQQLVYASNLGCWLPLAGIFYDSRHGGPRNTVYVGGEQPPHLLACWGPHRRPHPLHTLTLTLTPSNPHTLTLTFTLPLAPTLTQTSGSHAPGLRRHVALRGLPPVQ